MSTSAYMPLYVSDYLIDTAHLTTEESGAYLLLIMTYWQRGKPLPADPHRLAMIARLPNERWTDVQRTLEQFFTVEGGCWVHGRIEKELQRYRDRSEKAKKAGKASGESRKEPETNERSTSVQPETNGRSTDVQLQRNQSESDSTPKEINIKTTTNSEAARACEELLNDLKVGVEWRRGKIAPETKARVCRLLDITDADEIEDRFWAWQQKLEPSKRAKDPDAVFVSGAEKLLSRLTPTLRDKLKARQPEIITKPPSKPSSALLATLRVGGRA